MIHYRIRSFEYLLYIHPDLLSSCRTPSATKLMTFFFCMLNFLCFVHRFSLYVVLHLSISLYVFFIFQFNVFFIYYLDHIYLLLCPWYSSSAWPFSGSVMSMLSIFCKSNYLFYRMPMLFISRMSNSLFCYAYVVHLLQVQFLILLCLCCPSSASPTTCSIVCLCCSSSACPIPYSAMPM